VSMAPTNIKKWGYRECSPDYFRIWRFSQSSLFYRRIEDHWWIL